MRNEHVVRSPLNYCHGSFIAIEFAPPILPPATTKTLCCRRQGHTTTTDGQLRVTFRQTHTHTNKPNLIREMIYNNNNIENKIDIDIIWMRAV